MDALLALMQRTVFVVPWPAGVDGYRTLINSDGVAAMPIFTDRAELENAAGRWGWVSPDGTVDGVEIGARQALHYARTQGLAFIVIDIAADHGAEISREEFEPLLTAAARRESSGPFAGAGRISSTLMRAVKPSSMTPAPGSIRAPTPPPGSLPAVRRDKSSESSPGAVPVPEGVLAEAAPATAAAPEVAAIPGAAVVPGPILASMPLGAIDAPPSDEVLDAVSAVFRDYPEVDWGCIGATEHGPTLGLRVHEALRTRLDEISARASEAAGASLPIVLLDSAVDVKTARAEALAFYPWRRR